MSKPPEAIPAAPAVSDAALSKDCQTAPPMAYMAITYTVEPRDLRAFQRYAGKHLPGLRRNRYITAFMLVVCALVWTLSEKGQGLAVRIGFLVFLLVILAVFWWLLAFVIRQILQWRIFTSDKHRAVLCEHTLTLAEDALIEVTAFNESRSLWRGIYRVADAPDYIYIFTSVHAGHMVPKRAFPDAQSARQFYEEAVRLHSRTQQAASQSSAPVARPVKR